MVPLLLALTTSLSAAAPVITEGWDWSLPAGVQPAEYSGYVTWGKKRFDPAITVRGVMATWAKLNPSPGVYDWDWLTAEIEKNSQAGMRTGLHLKGVQREAVPEWVIEKYQPVVLDVPPLQENQPWRIQIVPPWQPEVEAAFNEFLAAFAKTGIAQREEVVYGYIHGVSASRGEEMFIRPVDLKLWEETTGVTADQFAGWLKRRLDAFCAAFKGVEFKLATMFAGPLGVTAEFRAATLDLWKYPLDHGTGIRGGGIDFMHGLFHAPGWASRLDDRGYCVIDDSDPVIAERRFRGDENEEYGKYWEWRFGPVEGYPYRHRICVLRGLQMRQNFQYVSPATLALNPELNEYARLVQGYRRDDAPDAWAYLRECYPRLGPVKNIERWLIQRDLPGSESVPAERVDRFPLASDSRDRHYDFDARRTCLATEQNGLLFRLDRTFWPKPAPATVKVTYTDRSASRWWLRYTDGQGASVKTESVVNVGDGKRKTATFELPQLSAAGKFPNDPGYRAWQRKEPESTTDCVQNGDFSQGETGWKIGDCYQVADDPERPGRHRLDYSFKFYQDTPHVDQWVVLKKGQAYRLSAEILNAGTNLRPCVRLAGRDWQTLHLLAAEETGRWLSLSKTFLATADGPVRLQLFGQGRQYHAPAQSGESHFRNISLRPVAPREALSVLPMDFRLETSGPGDVIVTLVRVIKQR